MSEKTLYELLGVERDATTEEIKEAYREIARVLHPDSNFYDEILEYEVDGEQLGLFKIVTSAYHTLINQQKRADYDRTLPPELRGWDDKVDEDAIIQAKLAELGLRDPLPESAKPSPAALKKSNAFGTFGKVPEPAPPPPSPSPNTASGKSAYASTPEAPHTAPWMGISSAASMSGATHKAVSEPAIARSPILLYIIAGLVSFSFGIGLVLLLLNAA
jgi:hypothetical protein